MVSVLQNTLTQIDLYFFIPVSVLIILTGVSIIIKYCKTNHSEKVTIFENERQNIAQKFNNPLVKLFFYLKIKIENDLNKIDEIESNHSLSQIPTHSSFLNLINQFIDFSTTENADQQINVHHLEITDTSCLALLMKFYEIKHGQQKKQIYQTKLLNLLKPYIKSYYLVNGDKYKFTKFDLMIFPISLFKQILLIYSKCSKL